MIVITINTDNDTLDGIEQRNDRAAYMDELNYIIRQLLDQYELGHDVATARDSNGNSIATISMENNND